MDGQKTEKTYSTKERGLVDNLTIGIKSLLLLHQNICGLWKKVDELIISLPPNICLCMSHRTPS
jgi:hypothetical protein